MCSFDVRVAADPFVRLVTLDFVEDCDDHADRLTVPVCASTSHRVGLADVAQPVAMGRCSSCVFMSACALLVFTMFTVYVSLLPERCEHAAVDTHCITPLFAPGDDTRVDVYVYVSPVEHVRLPGDFGELEPVWNQTGVVLTPSTVVNGTIQVPLAALQKYDAGEHSVCLLYTSDAADE